VLEAKVQGLSLAAVGLGENHHLACRFFAAERASGDFEREVRGAVVDYDYKQVGIVGIERSLDRAFDNLLLVIGGDQDRHFRPIGGYLLRRSVYMGAKTVVDRENAD